MSFKFGLVDTASSPGVLATLRSWPSLAGLDVETIDSPGADGVFFGGTSRSRVQFVFDVILSGDSPEETFDLRDQLVAGLDPALGEQELSMDAAEGWRWQAIVSSGIDWDRLAWDGAAGFRLRGDVTFDVLSAFGYPADPESWSWSTTGSRTVTPEDGNTTSYPTVEVVGVLSSSESVTVTVGDVEVTVEGPLASDEVLRLDYDRFDFARWKSGSKVANVIGKMSGLGRASLRPHEPVTISVATDGSLSSITVLANSRLQ